MSVRTKLTSLLQRRRSAGRGGSDVSSTVTNKLDTKHDQKMTEFPTRDTSVNQSGVESASKHAAPGRITSPIISKYDSIHTDVLPARGVQTTPGETHHGQTRIEANKDAHFSRKGQKGGVGTVLKRFGLALGMVTDPKVQSPKTMDDSNAHHSSKKNNNNPKNPTALSPLATFPQLQQFMLGTALVASVLGLFFLIRLQFVESSPQTVAYPTALVRPNRTLSFQGRLTDTAQNPVTSPTDMAFRLYDTGPGTGGNLLWDSGTCSVTPDQDGIFSTGLGENCGSEITDDVFSENASVWLEVEVETETLTPRQHIKAVAYALNAETLQGYPATASAVENTVVVMNNTGQIVLGNNTPVITATSPSGLTINGEVLMITTNNDGNIILNPDGLGEVLVESNLGVTGAATVGASLAVGYTNAPAGSGNAVFSGNVGIGTTSLSTATLNITSPANDLSMFQTNGTVSLITWLGTNSAGFGTQSNSDLGFFTNDSAYHMTLTTGGNLGIGTETPSNKLAVISTTSPQFRIGYDNSSNYMTTGVSSSGVVTFNANGSSAGFAFSDGVNITGNLGVSGAYVDSGSSSGTPGYVLTSTGTGTAWMDIVSGVGGENLWQETSAVLHPKNYAWSDLAIGGYSTASARFRAEAATGNVVSIGTVQGAQLISTVSTGTAPLTVGSATVVTNLNADLLDGFHANTLQYVNNATNATLTRSGAGPYTLELNLANANTWTGVQTFSQDTIFQGNGIWETSGNVGIGTTSPQYELDVDGNVHITGLTASMPVKTDANKVLISALIDLATDVTGTLPVGNGGTGATTLTGVLKGNGTGPITAMTGTANRVAYWTDSNTIAADDDFFFDGTSVGIGTTVPTQALDINGDLRIRGNDITDSADTARIGLGATTTLTNTTTTLSGTTTLTASSLATLTTSAALNWGGLTSVVFTADNIAIHGSDNSNGDLTLRGTNHGTKTNSYVLLQDTGGNVGIGTTSAADFRLQVNGGIGPHTNNTHNLGSNSLRWSTVHATSFQQAGNNVCDASGNCGVISWTSTNGAIHPLNVTQDLLLGGTATSSAKFAALNMNSGTPTASVSAGLAGGMFMTATGHLSTTARQNITLGNSATFDTTGDILLQPNGTRLVGIGTTTPTELLHVAGNFRLTGALLDGTNSSGGAGQVLTSTVTGTDWVDASSLSVGDAGTLDGLDSGDFLRSNVSDSYTGTGTLDFVSGTTLDINGNLSIADTDIVLDGATTNFTSTGNVSINNTQFFLNQSSGNIGIGTSAPTSFKLEIAGGIGPTADDTYDLGGTSRRWRDLFLGPGSLHIGTSSTDEGVISYDTGNNILGFSTDSTTNADIAFFTNDLYLDKSTSRVGIGTTAPGYLLDVRGDASVSGNLGLAGSLSIRGNVGLAGYYLRSRGAGLPPEWTDMSASLLPPGSTGQTLRYDGAAWSATSSLYNDGTNIGIGTTTTGAKLDVLATAGPQLRVGYNSSNAFTTTVTSAGAVTFDASGGSAGFTFSDPVTISGGSINGTTIGASTPSTGAFTTLSTTGATTLGNNSSTVQINSNTWDVSTAGVGSGFTGFSSSGNIDLSSLSAGGIVRAAPSTGRLEVAVAGTDYELPLTFSNGLTRTSNAVTLGGSLTGNTDIPLAGFNLALSGTTGNVGIGPTSPAARLDVAYTDTGASNRDAIASNLTVNSSGAFTGVGVKSFANFTGTSGSLQGLYGLFGRTIVSGSGGTVSNAAPVQVEADVGTGATVTNLHMVNVIAPSGSGTITNLRGISIGDMNAGTNSWALYQAGASDRSYFAGNVGIGSVDPGSKLDVTGNIRLSGGINSTGDNIAFHTNKADDTTYEWLGFYSGATRQGIILYDGSWSTCNSMTNVLCLAAENSNWLNLHSVTGTIITGGNVGIGTTTAGARLDVAGNTYVRGGSTTGTFSGSPGHLAVKSSNSQPYISFHDDAGARIGYVQGSDSSSQFNVWNQSNAAMRFGTNNTEQMRIAANGNVGMGTTGPGAQLDVAGSTFIRGSSTNATFTAPSQLAIKNGNNEPVISLHNNAGTLLAYMGNYTSTGMRFINVANTPMDFGTNNTVRLTIAAGGAATFNSTATATRLLVSTDGTAAAPAFSWSADPNNGMFRLGPQTIGFSTDGAERMRITDVGTIGIGTTNPGTNVLQVNGTTAPQFTVSGGTAFIRVDSTAATSNGARLQLSSTDINQAREAVVQYQRGTTDLWYAGVLYNAGSANTRYSIDTANNLSSSVPPFNITSAGNVGIGTINPGAALAVSGSLSVSSSISAGGSISASSGSITGAFSANTITAGSGGSNSIVSNTTTGTAVFGDATTTGWGVRGRTSTGQYGVLGQVVTNAAGRYGVYCDATLCGGGAVWTNTSDGRLKENVTVIPNALNTVLNLRGVNFNWKSDGRADTGFIAQEVLEQFPLAVSYDPTRDVYSMSATSLVGLLVEAMKEQNTHITNLHTAVSSSDLTLTSVGSVVISGSSNNYAVTPVGGGPALTKIIGVAQGVVGKLYAGLVSTKDLVVSGSGQIANLSVNSLSVAGQSLQAYIESVVNNMQLAGTTSLPEGTLVVENLVATGSAELAEVSTESLTAETATVTGTLAATELTAGKTSLGELLSTEVVVLGDATVSGNLTVAGDITASGSARLAALEGKLAQFENLQARTASLYDATVSGTLYANTIANLDSLITTSVQPTLLQQLIGYDPAATNSAQLLSQITGVDLSQTIVLDPAALDTLPMDATLLGAHAGFFNQYLQVNGNFAVGGDTLMVGKTTWASGLAIDGQSLSYTPQAIDECSPEYWDESWSSLSEEELAQVLEAHQTQCREHITLKIQPTGSGVLDLMNGLVTLADGKVVIDGEVTFKQPVTIETTLLTDLVAPTDFDRPFQLQVAGIATESGEVKKSRFELIDELGAPVATISAEGVAQFKGEVTAKSLGLTGKDDLTDETGTEVNTTAKTGKAVIKAGTSQLTIKASKTTESSLIFVTAQGSTGNQTLYVKSQTGDNPATSDVNEAQFVAGFDNPTDQDVTFTWWVVN